MDVYVCVMMSVYAYEERASSYNRKEEMPYHNTRIARLKIYIR